MSAHSLISKESGKVVNIIEVNPIAVNYCGPDDVGITSFIVPDGFILIEGNLPINSEFNTMETKTVSEKHSMDDTLEKVKRAEKVIKDKADQKASADEELKKPKNQKGEII